MTSSNVANDGNFSIQVIQRALEQFGKIKCIPILQEDVANSIKDYCDEEAYICNSKDHWLTIRKIHGVWYNLNSTNWMPPGGSGPQIIGNFYLGAFLDSIQNSGFTIFVIRHTGFKLPLANKDKFGQGPKRDCSHYFTPAEIDKYHKTHKNVQLNFRGQDERELNEQLQNRLKQDGEGGEEVKKEEEPKFQAFTG